MPQMAENLKLPICILITQPEDRIYAKDTEKHGAIALIITVVVSGDKNLTWIPESTMKSYQYLAEKNGPELYTRYVAPGYPFFFLFHV